MEVHCTEVHCKYREVVRALASLLFFIMVKC